MENDPRLALGELSSQLLLCESPDKDDLERIGSTLKQLQNACTNSQWATIASVANDFLKATAQDVEGNLVALTAACAQLEKYLYEDATDATVYQAQPPQEDRDDDDGDGDDGNWGFDEDEDDFVAGGTQTLPDPLPQAIEVARGPEEIENLADFYSEAMDAVEQNERVLLAAQERNLSPHDIGALFRSFHSIKGIAGFIGLTQSSKLAHRTESLLGVIRTGQIVAGQHIVDILLETNQCMHTLVESVRGALESRMSVPLDPSVDLLCTRIDQAAEPDGEGLRSSSDAKHHPTPVATRSPGGTILRDTLKVDVERVDSLVEMVGEMVIVESMIAGDEALDRVRSPKLTGNLRQMAKITQDLQKIALQLRMVPVRALFTRTARMVRELARQCDKDIHFEAQGEGTEIDRNMVELLADPILHIIRNAVDHGIEQPHERKADDKPERGTLQISAYHESSNLVIEIADDGRGLDTDALLMRARQRGLVSEGQVLSDAEIFNLIFEPGFSTAESVTNISGRGVGMDVVRKNIKSMRGRISISSRPGEGTTFRLVLPLTLAIIDGTLISCGGETYIVPTLSIIESIRPTANMIRNPCSSGELLQIRGKTYPLHRLATILDIDDARQNLDSAHAVLIEAVNQSFALLVDNVVSQQQVVIKRLEQRIQNSAFSGAAILSDGRIGLIINVDEITALVDAPPAREVA